MPREKLRSACDARGLATHGTQQQLVGRLAALLVPLGPQRGYLGRWWLRGFPNSKVLHILESYGTGSTIEISESGHDSLETLSEVALQFWREENLDIGDHRSD